MKLQIEASLFKDYISAISTLINEVELAISKEGISAITMDDSNVAMVIAKLKNTSFLNYDVETETKLGINLNDLLTVLKRAKKDESVTLEEADNKLQIKVGPGRQFTLPIIELENTEQKVPELDHTVTIDMPIKVLSDSLKDIDVVSESIKFVANQDELKLLGEDELTKAIVQIKKNGETKITGELENQTIESKYALEYLNKMMLDLTKQVKVKFAKNYPMKIIYDSDKMSVSYILAPRVDNS